MKILWIFTLFMILTLGTSISIKWLFGAHHPWEPISLAFRTMRPSEYVVLAGMLIVFFVTVAKKQIEYGFRFLFSRWSRFLKVSASSSGSNSASMQKSGQKEQQGKDVNK
jgi:hypothetical protein